MNWPRCNWWVLFRLPHAAELRTSSCLFDERCESGLPFLTKVRCINKIIIEERKDRRSRENSNEWITDSITVGRSKSTYNIFTSTICKYFGINTNSTKLKVKKLTIYHHCRYNLEQNTNKAASLYPVLFAVSFIALHVSVVSGWNSEDLYLFIEV
jgi:hypothetical protein